MGARKRQVKLAEETNRDAGELRVNAPVVEGDVQDLVRALARIVVRLAQEGFNRGATMASNEAEPELSDG